MLSIIRSSLIRMYDFDLIFTYYVYSMNECLNKIPENSKITVLNIVSTWTYFINVKSPKL